METRVPLFWDSSNVEERRRNNLQQQNTPGPGTEPFTQRARSTPNRLVTTELTLTMNDKARDDILHTSPTEQDNNGLSNM